MLNIALAAKLISVWFRFELIYDSFRLTPFPPSLIEWKSLTERWIPQIPSTMKIFSKLFEYFLLFHRALSLM